ncbi:MULTISPECIES: branched-chain amino acid ABC transporter ATP-binding protein/permease [unclassified Brenneria]|uniref:branched-chain amino acid ABC transporter ATP-binding protein/permease n=1 Tax=unclassified Brenneria TaxID=2634434 RepID=UPI001551F252|nr:ATP-binding cassette domain-containing protein [Brenneria sp. hezel4-2-4]MEE3649912.1 ATP-binding cassette domain-containing protein [Brenneria sp. HEZEL_4_2_4]NPC99870.1 ATP-binding cassette domain-containing protein [Brenneria sp. hezel4-2-4]
MRAFPINTLALMLLGVISLLLPGFLGSYTLLVFSLFALGVTTVVGLNILLGLSGQVSFGHIAFYALGAYVSAGLTMAGLPLGVAMLAAMLVCGLIGGLLAIPALRVSGPFLAMITIAFALVVRHLLIEWREVTGGSNGLMGIPMPEFGGLDPALGLAVCCGLLMMAALCGFARLQHSQWGLAMRAVKASEIAARSLGFNPVVSKTLAFTLSAMFTSAAGALVAPLMMFINPDSFPFSQSILFILAVVIGGSGTLLGPVLGALLIVVLPELLSTFAEYRLLIFAVLLLTVLWLAPRGILGTLARWLAKPPVQFAPQTADDALLRGHFKHSGNTVLKVENIGIRFGGVQAAKDISFQVQPGEVLGLIGPNGAGKTTVLNMISGFYRADSGSIRLQQELRGLPAWRVARNGIARTYQTTQLFSGMSVLENLLVAQQRGRQGLPWRRPTADAHEVAMALLALVGYRGSVHTPAEDLPHVDRRLVEIARALALNPALLLLDEPAAGLSREETDALIPLLRRLAGFGLAVIVVEHDMALVMAVSDRIQVLDAGKPLAQGAPAEVQRNPAVVAAYLGGTDYRGKPRRLALQSNGQPGLVVSKLTLDYGAAPVVRDVSFTVNPGETVAILGANGAGKSTILQTLAGLHPARSGAIYLHDRSIKELNASQIAARGLALVPEGRQLFPQMSVLDNLLIGQHACAEKHDPQVEVESVLKRFPRLRERLHSPAGLLSGGEQQMVAIGRGLMSRPSILLLDEPSLGLSPAMIGELYDALAALRDEGVTLLLVDQMANLALTIADRALVLESGTVVKAGRAQDLLAQADLADAWLGVANG